MRRFLTRLVLVPLALLFLFEAWLWDRLAPVVAALVAHLPLRRLKAGVRAGVARLSPGVSLLVFLVPGILLFPLKLLAAGLLGKGHWVLGMLTFAFAKVVGVGVTAFLFDVTREKLLSLRWFRVFYELVLRLRAAARELVAPVERELRRLLRAFGPGRAGRTLRLLRRLAGRR